METMKAIALRKSTRDFGPKPVSHEDLEKIVRAGCAAPVGHGEYETLRLSAITDKALLKKIVAAGAEANNDPQRDIIYGATALVVVFVKNGSQPALSMANAGCVATQMLLAATDLGIDSVYVWSTALAFREDDTLFDDLGIPNGFEPLASVALGYSAQPDTSEKPMGLTIQTDFFE